MIRRSRSYDGVLDHLRETTKADRSVIAQPKRLLRTWKNSVEREVIADSRKEFALAFALAFAFAFALAFARKSG